MEEGRPPVKSRAVFIFCLLIFCFVLFSCSRQAFDVVISGGTIIDGTGLKGFVADVGLGDGVIQKIGKIKASLGERIIDARNHYVVPGFIDVHTHGDSGILDERRKSALNYLHQGVTTLVGGNCGGGTFDVSSFFSRMEEQGIGLNVVHLVGHGTIRQAVMKSADGAPDDTQMAEMKTLVRQAMEEGSLGLSSGLFYAPGSFAQADELVELCRVVKEYGGIYATHIRDESDYTIGLEAAVKEAVDIGERAGVTVQISHIKALGKPVWGLSENVAKIIESARNRGVSVYADQYPYTASSTSLTAAVIPRWVQAGGRMWSLLSDESRLPAIKTEIAGNIERRGGADTLVLASFPKTPEWEGKSLLDISLILESDPVDTAIELVQMGGASLISFNMTDEDVEFFMTKPWVMTGSDGSLVILGNSLPHPRSYGTFPRKIRSYVLDKKLLSMEQAIRASSGLPADMLGFKNRGKIVRGAVADIVIFDPAKIRDRATYTDPHQYSEGILYVLIGGNPVIEEGRYNGMLAGKPLRKGIDF